ncbi:MAG: hypothetical protein J6J23_01170 [Clostridia bacterium]|nr:hypothetical protein [Clostridia bacterium]
MKLAFVINGKGGVGKDSFCDAVATTFDVRNISSVDPVKSIAKMAGWSGAKEDKDRKFLSDLKQLLTDYNELPTSYCLSEFKKFLASEVETIMFVHIREPKEIQKFIDATDGRCLSLLIRRPEIDRVYGNASDDNVENYDYDYVYENNKSLEEMEADVIEFISRVIEKESLKAFPHEK